MAIIFEGIDRSHIFTNGQARLMTHRLALEAADDYYKWISAYSVEELVSIGMSQDSAQSLLTAFADAHEEAVLYNGGALDPTYTLPYNFSASQRKIIGPQF